MRFRFFVVLLLVGLIGAPFASAQPASAPASRPATRPAVRVERDLAYITDGTPAQRLDLYLPTRAYENPLPLIIYVHGGGWRGGSKSGCPATGFVLQGYAVASIEYRFSGVALFPAQIQDCQAAVRWLRGNAAKYNLDPHRFAAWGGSAGGHLVALLGTAGGADAFPKIGEHQDQSEKVQAVIDVFGPANFASVKAQAAADPSVKSVFNLDQANNPYAQLIGVKLGEDSEKEKAVSPITYISKDDPPVLIFHGTKDALVPFAQSVEFAEALEKAGVNVQLIPVEGAGHGGKEFGSPENQKILNAFIEKHLKNR